MIVIDVKFLRSLRSSFFNYLTGFRNLKLIHIAVVRRRSIPFTSLRLKFITQFSLLYSTYVSSFRYFLY